MTNGGWLGDCQVSDEPSSAMKWDAETAETYRLIELGAKAERDQTESDYLEQDLRERLWHKYQEHMDALDKHAPSTLKRYVRLMEEWAKSCADAGLNPLPATPGMVATYLDHKLSNGASPETIRAIAAAISCAHEAYELRDPTTALLVRGIVRAARTYKRKKPNGKAH